MANETIIPGIGCTSFLSEQNIPINEAYIPKNLFDALKYNLKEYPKMNWMTKEYVRYINSLKNLKCITEDNFFLLLKLMLLIEQYVKFNELQKFNGHKYIKLDNEGCYIIPLHTSNINLLQIKETNKVIINYANINNKQKNILCPIIEVCEAYIRVKPPEENSFKIVYDENVQYYVEYLYIDFPMKVFHFALQHAYKNNMKHLLFPTVAPKVNLKVDQSMKWFDEKIKNNFEQKQAIISILNKTAFPAPFILFGPPGTGKTLTLVEAVHQICHKEPSSRILICTPSNATADDITRKILNFLPPNDLYRLFASSRKFDSISKDIQECTNYVDEKIIFLPLKILKLKKIIICTLVTCIRLKKLQLRKNYFSHIFIDEASQATEPEILIPFIICDNSTKGYLQAQVIIVGDHCQLGPVIHSQSVKHLLGMSMLERLVNTDLYKKGENGKYNPNYIVKLLKNFRNHKSILEIPNSLFYENDLIPCGGIITNRALKWSELPNENFPLIFHSTRGVEKKTKTSTSPYNLYEVEVVLYYLKQLIGKKLGKAIVKQSDVAIITPFKMQEIKLSDALKSNGYPNVIVGTVEILQGSEKDIVIFTTVRSKILHHDNKVHLGFLSSEKRFNVAITRARALLIVIGNPIVLETVPFWKKFIEFCQANSAITKKLV